MLDKLLSTLMSGPVGEELRSNIDRMRGVFIEHVAQTRRLELMLSLIASHLGVTEEERAMIDAEVALYLDKTVRGVDDGKP